MSRHEVQDPPVDVHAKAKTRFEAAFGEVGDAILATDDGEVLLCTGPLAQTIARVGGRLIDLPDGVSSDTFNDVISRVQHETMRTETAQLVVVNGPTISARVVSGLSEDGERRYLILVLMEEVGSDELGRLRRRGRLFQLLFERAPSGVSLVGADGKFVGVNPAYCRLVGRSEDELLQLRFQDITHPDDVDLDVALTADMAARRIDRYDIDKRYVRPDGSIVWVHLTAAPLADEGDQPMLLVAMLEDITARRLAQEELQTTLELWRTTFEAALVAMIELEVDGTIRRANAAAGALVGCEPDELIGLRTVDLGDPAEFDDASANLRRFATGELLTNTAERRLQDRSGRWRWVSVHTVAVLTPDGAVDRLLMQALDVTEERELRDRLQQSVTELSVAYRENAALMTALSHDLRTPLATIRILAELLVASDAATPDGERRELADRLLAEASRTEGVLGDIVAAEKASAGLMTPRRVPVALNDLVSRVVHAESDRQASHTVIVRLPETDCVVSIDPALVERIVVNLLSNAYRHTPSGSTVWVSVMGDTESDDHTARLVVEDNGDGVDDSLKQAIFEPFVRGSVDRPGSGIGLFLVRRFAEFHGGTVECIDRLGGGASFVVTLPSQ